MWTFSLISFSNFRNNTDLQEQKGSGTVPRIWTGLINLLAKNVIFRNVVKHPRHICRWKVIVTSVALCKVHASIITHSCSQIYIWIMHTVYTVYTYLAQNIQAFLTAATSTIITAGIPWNIVTLTSHELQN